MYQAIPNSAVRQSLWSYKNDFAFKLLLFFFWLAFTHNCLIPKMQKKIIQKLTL